jgi:hypothetical protein
MTRCSVRLRWGCRYYRRPRSRARPGGGGACTSQRVSPLTQGCGHPRPHVPHFGGLGSLAGDPGLCGPASRPGCHSRSGGNANGAPGLHDTRGQRLYGLPSTGYPLRVTLYGLHGAQRASAGRAIEGPDIARREPDVPCPGWRISAPDQLARKLMSATALDCGYRRS